MNNDLISRSALLEVIAAAFFETEPTGDEQLGYLACSRIVREFPAVDAEPVQHGRWISEVISKRDWKGRMRDYYQACSCPFCHEPDPGHGVSNYCANCGAKMGGEKKMRLIDADAMCEGLVSNHPVAIAAACAPTVDAVEVVRCKDCVHRRPLSVDGVEPEVLVCVNKNMFPLRVKPDFYCAHGDRRDVKE